jgi:hypothetical protein
VGYVVEGIGVEGFGKVVTKGWRFQQRGQSCCQRRLLLAGVLARSVPGVEGRPSAN